MVQYSELDSSFAALADPTRRGILHELTQGARTISDLAAHFEMTLTGIKKHVQLLEDAGLVVTEKQGRVRYCRLGSNALQPELAFIRAHQRALEARLDRLAAFLETP